jgi:hypothetical protein
MMFDLCLSGIVTRLTASLALIICMYTCTSHRHCTGVRGHGAEPSLISERPWSFACNAVNKN